MTIPALTESIDPALDLGALRRGEDEALAACYHAHAGRLLSVLERFTNSAADAEDVVHDVLVRLPALMAQYDERGRFEGWLTRVAIRAALMRSRRERKLVALDLVPVATSAEPASDYAALRLAREAVAALPDALRHVLVLRVMLDHSHAEIAALLGISVGTSEVRLHRAIKQLRAQLGGSR